MNFILLVILTALWVSTLANMRARILLEHRVKVLEERRP